MGEGVDLIFIDQVALQKILLIHDGFLVTVSETVIAYIIYDGAMTI